MKIKYPSAFVFFILLTILLQGNQREILAQQNINLIIRQVYFDRTYPLRNWIEVLNPDDKPLILDRVRESHFYTVNFFSREIQDQGGIVVKAGESVILCADLNFFKSAYDTRIECIAVSPLSQLSAGGFVLIHTKGRGEFKGDVVRYGDPAESSAISKIAGSQVVAFSKDGKGFRRNVTITKTGIELSDFFETISFPGKP